MGTVRALSCSIYDDKFIGNCSNNGISNRYKEVYVICPDGNDEIDLDNPPENLVIFEEKDFGFRKHKRFHPYNKKSGKWNMFGGAFVWTCDSRFRKRFGDYPIPLFDRYE